jgi:hypothetical protein
MGSLSTASSGYSTFRISPPLSLCKHFSTFDQNHIWVFRLKYHSAFSLELVLAFWALRSNARLELTATFAFREAPRDLIKRIFFVWRLKQNVLILLSPKYIGTSAAVKVRKIIAHAACPQKLDGVRAIETRLVMGIRSFIDDR